MPLVNVVPHMVLHQKMHFLVSVYFLGRWKGLQAPCDVSKKLPRFDYAPYYQLPIYTYDVIVLN